MTTNPMPMTNTNLKADLGEIKEAAEYARELAEKFGLEPPEITYHGVSQDEMNQLIAYGGFQTRYPHWRWGMQYEQQRKKSKHGLGKAYEIVINTDPAHAFLQKSNDIADQKAVITHVEAHGDFFQENRWYRMFEGEDAASMLERHSDRVEAFMNRSDVSREEVERWIDNILPLMDTIDQHSSYGDRLESDAEGDGDEDGLENPFERMGFSEDIAEEVADEEFLESLEEDADDPLHEEDLLYFLYANGKQYDVDEGKAVEFEDWQREIINILRKEAYYFAPQKMTKVMNEGWAAFWESMMMGNEAFATADEIVNYADHQSLVLGSGTLNPYRLGKALWEHIENSENRREVVTKLLQVDGITWRDFHEQVDFDLVREELRPHPLLESLDKESFREAMTDPFAEQDEWFDWERLEDLDSEDEMEIIDEYPWIALSHEGMARRHYSLARPQNKTFVESIPRRELERIARYTPDKSKYGSIEQALKDVDYTKGWRKMRDIRASHNDITFIDEYLTKEFVKENNLVAYEFSHSQLQNVVSSTQYEDVKKKLLLQYTNFGKPSIYIADDNYDNKGELLICHNYNGVKLNIDQARGTLKRIFNLWGRPVHLVTIDKRVTEDELLAAQDERREVEPEEVPKRISYDGTHYRENELDWESEIVKEIAADEIDYQTKPDEWL